MEKATLSVTELARELDICETNAYRLVKRADFPAFQLGSRWVIPRRELLDWLARQAEEKAPLC
ncbi:MAG: helix-turn-helix domain-containing protein [Clostridiales bacterium]|nr:helix-turn-helix domain-containing protein [Clostridiales bacterium]